MTLPVFTAADVAAFFRDSDGRLICPQGDYSAVLRFGDECSFGDGCAAKSPLWAFSYAPPFATTGPILPTESARSYWEWRLSIPLVGCYADISRTVAPLIDSFLARTDISPCDRRIAESWRE